MISRNLAYVRIPKVLSDFVGKLVLVCSEQDHPEQSEGEGDRQLYYIHGARP